MSTARAFADTREHLGHAPPVELSQLGYHDATYGVTHYLHPVVDELTLDCDTWSNPDGSGQRLVVLTAEPGTQSHAALRILTSWSAEATRSIR